MVIGAMVFADTKVMFYSEAGNELADSSQREGCIECVGYGKPQND